MCSEPAGAASPAAQDLFMFTIFGNVYCGFAVLRDDYFSFFALIPRRRAIIGDLSSTPPTIDKSRPSGQDSPCFRGVFEDLARESIEI